MNSKGDTLHIGFSLKDSQTKQIIPREEIEDVVFQINSDYSGNSAVEKLLSRGEISYDVEGQFYYFDLSQEETFKLKEKNLYKVRVLDTLGNVRSDSTGSLNLEETINHRVLGANNEL